MMENTLVSACFLDRPGRYNSLAKPVFHRPLSNGKGRGGPPGYAGAGDLVQDGAYVRWSLR
jgi:hypothetical protein